MVNSAARTSTKRIDGAQSIRRAVALIRHVTEAGRDGSSVAELAVRTGVDRTTAHRILRCLAEEGLLEYNLAQHRFALGPLAYEIGAAAVQRRDLRAICQSALTRIAAETGDSVFLIVRAGNDSVCADRLEGSYPIKTLVLEIGNRRPLGIGAGSLAILGSLPLEEAEAAIAQNAGRITAFPGMNVGRLRKLVARVRAEGSASLDVTGLSGARAVAVPLRTAGGRPVAALSVAAINSRMNRERQAFVVTILRREAAALAPLLGSQTGVFGPERG